MLRQATLSALSSGDLDRTRGYLVVCMHYYPRHLKKDLRDEYQHLLAPDEKLLDDFLAMKKKIGDHNSAFRLVKYEERFRLSPEGLSASRSWQMIATSILSACAVPASAAIAICFSSRPPGDFTRKPKNPGSLIPRSRGASRL